MNWDTLRLLYVHELKMLLRGRRTVVMSIIVPALIMPLVLLGSRYSTDRRARSLAETSYRYAVAGPEADRVRGLIRDTVADNTLPPFMPQEISVGDPASSLENGLIHFYIQTSRKPSDPVPAVQIVFRGDRDVSRNGSERMSDLLRQARRNQVNLLLTARGFPERPNQVFPVDPESIATAAQVTGSDVGRFLTVILVMLMFTGGSIVAMDIIAGEKERGTLETLLTTAAGRTEIVTSKQLAITSVAIFIALVQALNFLVYIQFQLIELPAGFTIELPPGAIANLLLLFFPLAATIAAILLMVSAYAKTYKEAQLYFFPVYLLGLVPALAAVLPGISLRSAIALVPIANVSVAVREILMGRPDQPMIFVTFGVMAFTGLWLMRTSAQMLTRENIVAPGHFEAEDLLGGPGLFRKRVLRWFAVMWAVIFAAAANIPVLATFRAQLLFNELAIFLGASLLMMKVYRLNARDTLSLRSVRPAVWLGALIAIPAGHVMSFAVFRLVNTVIPAPQQLLEQFSRDFIPKDMPAWELYFFLAVLPAICEEIGFRGVLLYGLRGKLKPAGLVLAIGLIFGMFHITLFRIAPTAFMGVILTAVAIMTGSIYPGILIHMGNNAFAVWAADSGLALQNLRWQDYGAATMIFALAMWIIYRNGISDSGK